jgi:hypothetical protein
MRGGWLTARVQVGALATLDARAQLTQRRTAPAVRPLLSLPIRLGPGNGTILEPFIGQRQP